MASTAAMLHNIPLPFRADTLVEEAWINVSSVSSIMGTPQSLPCFPLSRRPAHAGSQSLPGAMAVPPGTDPSGSSRQPRTLLPPMVQGARSVRQKGSLAKKRQIAVLEKRSPRSGSSSSLVLIFSWLVHLVPHPHHCPSISCRSDGRHGGRISRFQPARAARHKNVTTRATPPGWSAATGRQQRDLPPARHGILTLWWMDDGEGVRLNLPPETV